MTTTTDHNGRKIYVSEDGSYETYLFGDEGGLSAAPMMIMAIKAARDEFPGQLLEVQVIARPAEATA
ncbi:hypothetical protein [Mycobacterium sp. E2733]|uniref:hypothetical protein n=1 Tax=Mycobacterium sp. E2733 TaxID=1834138 RepID=UPI0007FCDF21|nr:hypothetical protein [Mycobacterium sp. E2733]OBH94283.1 hypothetical protein A5678_04455 [Mycobacterium sp. E2733]